MHSAMIRVSGITRGLSMVEDIANDVLLALVAFFWECWRL